MKVLERILHVEDDPSIRAVARIALETVGGLAVLSCASGEEALTNAADFAPDMVLLDVMMPGMDGPNTLAALANRIDLKRTPVVFMTAKAQPSEVDHFLGLGAAGVVVKPFDPMRLASDLRDHWNRFHAGSC